MTNGQIEAKYRRIIRKVAEVRKMAESLEQQIQGNREWETKLDRLYRRVKFEILVENREYAEEA